MPCIIKERTATSPGIIVFTFGEVLGAAFAGRAINEFLSREVREGRWLFGIHVQGDFWLDRWPLRDWHSFIMWPDAKVEWLRDVPPDRIFPMACVNFTPLPPGRPAGMERNVDICVISRASEIKRIHEALLTIRRLMDLRPNLTVIFIVPDHRKLALGLRTYAAQSIDRRFFEMPLRIFRARELANLSFISTSTDAFGRFPVSTDLMTDMLYRSRFMFLTSHREGTPRVIAEALLTGAPCILSRHLKAGIRKDLDDKNALFIEDDIDVGARQIDEALTHYERFHVDLVKFAGIYGAPHNTPVLKAWLEAAIRARGLPVNGRWFLVDLHLRLASHGRRHNHQFTYRIKPFWDWWRNFELDPDGQSTCFDPYDEEAMLGFDQLRDLPSPLQLVAHKLKGLVPIPMRKALKRLVAR